MLVSIFFVRSAEKLSSSNVSFTSILKQTVEQIQAFLLNIAIYIAIQVASGLIMLWRELSRTILFPNMLQACKNPFANCLHGSGLLPLAVRDCAAGIHNRPCNESASRLAPKCSGGHLYHYGFSYLVPLVCAGRDS